MTAAETDRLAVQVAVVKNDVEHLTREVESMSVKLTAMHDKFMQDKGASKTQKTLFWGGVGLVGYLGSNLNTILSLFKGA